MKLNTSFKIEGPINLYHAERHIPSEPNMEVPPLERVCLSVNSQGNHFPYMELMCPSVGQDIMTNFGCMRNRSTVKYLPIF